jgi:hypothetical protein
MSDNLPPLPPSPADVSDLILQTREHVQSLGWGNLERLYTESQVRAIINECAAMAGAREGACKPVNSTAEDLYWRLESLSKSLESSGRIDQSEHPDAYATVLDAMIFVRTDTEQERARSNMYADLVQRTDGRSTRMGARISQGAGRMSDLPPPTDPLHDDAYLRAVALGFPAGDPRRWTLCRIADRIEKRDAEIERLRAELTKANEVKDLIEATLRTECDRMRAECDALRQKQTGFSPRRDYYSVPVLFNPYTGEPRDARDIASDPQGTLIMPPGAAIDSARNSK